jgi:hypothetical protein
MLWFRRVTTQSQHPMLRSMTFSDFIRRHVLQVKMWSFSKYYLSSMNNIALSDRRELSLLENRPMIHDQHFLEYQVLAQRIIPGHSLLSRRPFQNTNAPSRQLSNCSANNEEIDEKLCWGFRKRHEIIELLESEHRIAWQLVSDSTFVLFFFPVSKTAF